MLRKEKTSFSRKYFNVIVKFCVQHKVTSFALILAGTVLLCQPYIIKKSRIPITAEGRSKWIEQNLPAEQKENLNSLVNLNKNKKE